MDYKTPANAYIRALYSPGFSSLTMSFFKTYLTLNFVPWLGRDNLGRSQYSKNEFLSTTIDHEKASFFYLHATRILEGKASGEPIHVVLPCNNGTTLTFEYKPDENNQMTAYLTINKNNQTIVFKFPKTEYHEKIDGQEITSIMQSGLGTFALILGCYITGSAANSYLDRYNEILEWIQDEEHEKWEQEMAIAKGGDYYGSE